MLTEIYIEALLVDEELADQVWEAWHVGLIPDELAALAWWCILFLPLRAQAENKDDTKIALVNDTASDLDCRMRSIFQLRPYRPLQ